MKLLMDIGVSVSNFWLVILQRQRRTKNRVTRLGWKIFGKIEDGPTVLQSYHTALEKLHTSKIESKIYLKIIKGCI